MWNIAKTILLGAAGTLLGIGTAKVVGAGYRAITSDKADSPPRINERAEGRG